MIDKAKSIKNLMFSILAVALSIVMTTMALPVASIASTDDENALTTSGEGLLPTRLTQIQDLVNSSEGITPGCEQAGKVSDAAALSQVAPSHLDMGVMSSVYTYNPGTTQCFSFTMEKAARIDVSFAAVVANEAGDEVEGDWNVAVYNTTTFTAACDDFVRSSGTDAFICVSDGDHISLKDVDRVLQPGDYILTVTSDSNYASAKFALGVDYARIWHAQFSATQFDNTNHASVSVHGAWNSKGQEVLLFAGSGYTVTKSYSKKIGTGTGSATVAGCGGYTGTAYGTFDVVEPYYPVPLISGTESNPISLGTLPVGATLTTAFKVYLPSCVNGITWSWGSSRESVATVVAVAKDHSKAIVKGQNAGVCYITARYDAIVDLGEGITDDDHKSVVFKVVVKGAKVGAYESCGKGASKAIYKVLSNKTNTVTLLKGFSYKTAVTVPKTVTMEGKVYKVTGIAKGAFKACKKLKRITIVSTTLTKAGVKGCLKGSKITMVKVPKAKKVAYKRIFTKANCGKKVTVK